MSENRKSILLRTYAVYVIALLFAFVIIGKIIYIQYFEGNYWKGKAETAGLRHENIDAVRGNIYADDESMLATSVSVYDVGMDISPELVHDSIFYSKIDSLSQKLGVLFGKQKTYYKDKLVKARKSWAEDAVVYILIKRDVSYSQLKQLETFPIFNRGRNKSGLVVDEKEKRELPFKNLAKRTIGYVQLAQYKVSINFAEGNIRPENFNAKVDTIALCMYNLFQDGVSVKKYKQILQQCYLQNLKFKKSVDSRQLAQMERFPLLEGMNKHNGFHTTKLKQEYLVGLEGAYNDTLSGRDGVRILRKIGGGVWKVISAEDVIEPKNGADIYTTIDVNLQDVAENALRKCLDSNNAEWGCAVMMEVKTGFVKAISNLSANSDGSFSETYNYAVGEQIEPGSTFKLASLIAILEEKKYDTASLVPTGKRKIGNREVTDAHGTGGLVTLAKAFERSSNVGISFAAYNTFVNKIGKFKQYLEAMGLTDSLGVEIAGEKTPTMNIAHGDLETIPFGYVVKLTPIQILSLYNAVANNGLLVRPSFVKSVRRTGKVVKTYEPVVLRKSICSAATLKKVRALLEGVVLRGTATNISKSVYGIAGKTGTVKVFENGRYMEDKYVASFVGYFPVENPMYSCIVVVYKPNGNEYYGSQIAAPVFKEIADKVYATRLDIPGKSQKITSVAAPLPRCGYQSDLKQIYSVLHFGVVPEQSGAEWVTVSREKLKVRFHERQIKQDVMPDVRGMTARDAVYMLEKMGMCVNISGKGKVKIQSPLPGENFAKDQKVKLHLGLS